MEKKTRILSLALVLATFVIFCFYPEPSGFGLVRGHIWSRITYLWFHGNILHWAINNYALCTLTFCCEVAFPTMMVGLLAAVIIPDFLIGSMPIVGMSGWLFFLVGSLAFRMNRYNRFRFVLSNLFVIIVTSLLSHIAWGIHLWCFALGILYSYAESHKATNKQSA